jgi:Uma2 family endonuclease
MVTTRSGRMRGREVNGVPATPAGEVFYPESDGAPLGETQLHGALITTYREVLEDHFAADPNVYVWMNLFIYYKEGDPASVVCPDVFVAIGAPKEPPRRTYKFWEEPVPPTVVIEVSSESTRRADFFRKRLTYAAIGVQ